MDFVKTMKDRLVQGDEAEIIMNTVRERYQSINSVRTRANQIRMAYDGPLDDEGEEVAARLRSMCATDDERRRVEALVASYGRHRWTESNPANSRLDDAVREYRIHLLPHRVRECDVGRDELADIKKARKHRVTARHDDAPVIDLSRLLRHARAVVRMPHTFGKYDVILALLALTGRRTTEILNGKSKLKAVGSHALLFDGQLKTHDPQPYVIPVLASAAEIVATQAMLACSEVDDNRAVSRAHQSGIGRRLRANDAYGKNGVTHVHALRGIYALGVFNLFECGNRTIVSTTRACLGHASSDEGLAYTAYILHIDPTEVSLGELPPAVGTSHDQKILGDTIMEDVAYQDAGVELAKWQAKAAEHSIRDDVDVRRVPVRRAR